MTKSTPYPNLSRFAQSCLTNRRDTMTINREDALKIARDYNTMIEHLSSLQQEIIKLQNLRDQEIKIELGGGKF